MSDSTTTFAADVDRVLAEIGTMLKAKNAAYGNSALDPVRIFSKADAAEQINVRIDDKLSRIQRGSDAGEDVDLDLIGYLVLRRIAKARDETADEVRSRTELYVSEFGPVSDLAMAADVASLRKVASAHFGAAARGKP